MAPKLSLEDSRHKEFTGKILAVKLRAIGDTVIWTSALRSLRQEFPLAQIHVLTYASNSAVLKSAPFIDQEHYLATSSRFELGKKLWKLRREKFAWTLGFHATTSLCRWAWLVGSHRTILHHHSWKFTPRGSLPVVHPGQLENAILRDHRVVESIGLSLNCNPPATQITVSESEGKVSERLVQQMISECGGNVNLPRFAFLPGAGHHLRRLPKDIWLSLAMAMKTRGQFQPLVIVDAQLAQELNLVKECADLEIPLLGHGSLRDFITLVSRAKQALANDSGPGHIAVALGLKTTFAFGPGCVGDWYPYDPSLHPIFRIQVPCRAEGPRDQERFQYCTIIECSHHRCMRDLKISLPLATL